MRYLVAVVATVIAFGLTVSLPLFSDGPRLPQPPKSVTLPDMSKLDTDSLNHVPPQYDLNGMLEQINQNNTHLGTVNANILNALKGINDKSNKTMDVSNKLSLVYQGLGDQGMILGDMRTVTGQQVVLSQNLNRLSRFLHSKMNLISASANKQVSEVQRLRAITLDTKSKLQSALSYNLQMERKLSAAADKSKKAANSLP